MRASPVAAATRSRAATPTPMRWRCSSVLNGKPSPYRDVALLNAAAALIVAGRAKDLKDGVAIGAKSLDSGAAPHG